MRTESPLHQLSSLVREGVPERVMLGIHHIPSEALLTRFPFPAFGAVWTHCLARTSGALQPAAWRAMRSRATTAFDCTLSNQKKNGILIVIPIAAARTEEISIAAAGGQTWTETELWWSFLCNNVHSSEATHIASGALCASPLCTSPWLLAALPPVLALLSLGQLQAALLLL